MGCRQYGLHELAILGHESGKKRLFGRLAGAIQGGRHVADRFVKVTDRKRPEDIFLVAISQIQRRPRQARPFGNVIH